MLPRSKSRTLHTARARLIMLFSLIGLLRHAGANAKTVVVPEEVRTIQAAPMTDGRVKGCKPRPPPVQSQSTPCRFFLNEAVDSRDSIYPHPVRLR